jgi:HEAT repeat protein
MPLSTDPDEPALPADPAGQVTVRRRDAALAGHLGDEPAARRALLDPAPAVRATALGALARLEELRLDDLVAAGRDAEPEVRARAAELAVNLGPAAGALATAALSDGDDRVVEAGCFALGEIGSPADGIVERLSAVGREHRDPLCREAAVAALGAIGASEGLPAILSATTDKPAIRRRAVLALAAFEGPEVEAALARGLADRDWQVRQAAEDLTGRRPE